MTFKSALIISPCPLKPIQNGMQNTIFNLYKYLKKKNYKIYFINLNSTNKIDPILNLEFDNLIAKKIIFIKKKFSPRLIFVNTTKVLYQYRKELENKNSLSKTILVCHDLYHFRKSYFKFIKAKDNTFLRDKDEVQSINTINFIIDYSNIEKKYLLNKGINPKKLLYTHTPVSKIIKNNQVKKKKYDILLISSDWYQNELNFKFLRKKISLNKTNLKFLLCGKIDKKLINFKNISSRKFNIDYFQYCKLGLVLVKYKTGRITKIFEMMAAGIPVLTNVDLSEFKLKDNIHYKFILSKKSLESQILSIINNNKTLKLLSMNASSWLKKNSYFFQSFKNLEKIK